MNLGTAFSTQIFSRSSYGSNRYFAMAPQDNFNVAIVQRLFSVVVTSNSVQEGVVDGTAQTGTYVKKFRRSLCRWIGIYICAITHL